MIVLDNSFILDGISWSYSSINTYLQCPRAFKCIYIDAESKEQNAFAQWGSYMHSILESYYRGKLDLFDILQEYQKHYDQNVTIDFPPNKYVDLNQTYYEAGEHFCSEFNDEFARYKVLDIEKSFTTTIGGFNFVGVIDLILQDPDTHEYIIVDHKSHKFKNQKEINTYLMQLYLYATYVFETYKEYPTKLIFNELRTGRLIENTFEKQIYDECVEQFISVIHSIYEDTDFAPHIDDFFCSYLCSVRSWCPYSPRYIDVD